MASRMTSAGVLSLALFSTLAQPSFAGGLERGGYNIDLLFDQSRFSSQAAVIYVMPQRELENVKDNPARRGNLNGRPHSADETENYAVPYVGFKGGYEAVDCLLDYSEPFGVHTNPGVNWAGANSNVETKINTENYAATCSYKFDVGPGQLRFIGGTFYQSLDGFQEKLVAVIPPTFGTGVGRLDLADEAWGWRAGVAYEIPEYAMRASLVYNSRVKYDDLTGTLDLSQVAGGAVIPVKGSADAPDSLELKLQSGVAPDWLAFGSVKWTNWSVLQSVPFCPTNGLPCPAGGITSLDLAYRDGWTVMGGIGHKFDEQWTAALSLTWDRGTSDGYGSQTDTWLVGAGAAYNPNEHVEWRVAGSLGVMTSGESGTFTRDGVTYGNDATYTFGNDLVAAISTSIKVKF
ncbi:long-chain fatty acid transport protein [Rhizobium sp. BK181]|uniref:OmpP1/FadL family transporter n=1 Tax=Rhizobium sp. BK181 TaxID=2587072 RepID=UPI00161AD49A|nr:OmpP1/FadL family transporter [Rhizobium sp. BK181]MBB3318679.1 long-chain fatty acid transport protein [Rhizobium sp. BK181]